MTHRAIVGLLLLGLASPAFADEDAIPGHTVDRPVQGAVVGTSLGVGLVMQLIPIRSHDLWSSEISAIDEEVRDNFSRRAAHLSDGLLGLALATPAFYLMGTTIDDADGDKLMIYGETIAINTLLAGAAKRLVQRPRPYMYSKDPLVMRYAKGERDDGYLSFYSGHAALSFGAAVTGAYLLGATGSTKTTMALAWGGGMMVASATANLRVRAGKHFYSDVIIGGLIGMGVGYIVPALHSGANPYKPSGEEIAAGAAGILGGMLISSLIPLEKRTSELDERKTGLVHDLRLSPMPVTNGFGFAIGGGL